MNKPGLSQVWLIITMYVINIWQTVIGETSNQRLINISGFNDPANFSNLLNLLLKDSVHRGIRAHSWLCSFSWESKREKDKSLLGRDPWESFTGAETACVATTGGPFPALYPSWRTRPTAHIAKRVNHSSARRKLVRLLIGLLFITTPEAHKQRYDPYVREVIQVPVLQRPVLYRRLFSFYQGRSCVEAKKEAMNKKTGRRWWSIPLPIERKEKQN